MHAVAVSSLAAAAGQRSPTAFQEQGKEEKLLQESHHRIVSVGVPDVCLSTEVVPVSADGLAHPRPVWKAQFCLGKPISELSSIEFHMCSFTRSAIQRRHGAHKKIVGRLRSPPEWSVVSIQGGREERTKTCWCFPLWVSSDTPTDATRHARRQNSAPFPGPCIRSETGGAYFCTRMARSGGFSWSALLYPCGTHPPATSQATAFGRNIHRLAHCWFYYYLFHSTAGRRRLSRFWTRRRAKPAFVIPLLVQGTKRNLGIFLRVLVGRNCTNPSAVCR